MTKTQQRTQRQKRRRNEIKRQLHVWHWVSSAICLAGLILFSVTGITLNHAASIDASPSVVTIEDTVPAALADALTAPANESALPAALADWLADAFEFDVARAEPEWSSDELYIAQARPGGDRWIAIDRESGDYLFESTHRGLVAWLNDLHKGRDTSSAWRLFIDVFAVASCVFALTGLALLFVHSRRRPATWPVTALGIVLPGILLWIFGY